MAIKEVGPLQTGSSAVATGRVEATCTVAGGLEAPRNLAERVRQVASGAHEVASSRAKRLRAAETPWGLSSRIYLSGSPVPSFLPREPKPSAVVTSRAEGSNGLAHDYLYSRTSASLIRNYSQALVQGYRLT